MNTTFSEKCGTQNATAILHSSDLRAQKLALYARRLREIRKRNITYTRDSRTWQNVSDMTTHQRESAYHS